MASIRRVHPEEDTIEHQSRGHRHAGYGGMEHRVMIARFDSTTGGLAVDERFREDGATEPGFRMDDKTWPHGGTVKGIPHGAVFSRR